MKKLFVLVAVVGIGWLVYSKIQSVGAPNLTVNGDEVVLATDDLDVHLSRIGSLDGTFMIFGGGHFDHANIIGNVILSGLPVTKAKSISRRYPDFHRCSSQGASLAKDAIVDLQIVPADGKIMGALKSAIDRFNDNLRKDGDRVCLGLHGSKLRLESVTVREAGESITDRFGNSTFYLVESADTIDCQQAMAER